MCGIVGIIAKPTIPYHGDVLFKEMLRMDSIRGEDSTGVFGVNKDGKVDIVKADTNGWTFVQSTAYEKFHKRMWNEYQIAIGHNRSATKGAVSAANAHPFKVQNIVLVHNGTIRNAEDLNKEVEVDSHAIAHALASHKAVEALAKINGAFALVWYDMEERTLNLARNKERPLALLEYADMWVISSEVWLPQWLQLRAYKGEPTSIQAVPTEKILVFQLDQLNEKPAQVPFKEYDQWKPVKPIYKYPLPAVQPVSAAKHDIPQFGSPGAQKILMERIGRMQVQPGSTIRFQAETYEDGTYDRRLIGAPLIGTEVLQDILVQAVVPEGKTVAELLEVSDKFSARVINVRPIQGKIVWFVRDVAPIITLYDLAKREYEIDELARILIDGCGKCKGIIRLSDVGESVVDKKADGSYRLRCKECINLSLVEAKQKANSEGAANTDVH